MTCPPHILTFKNSSVAEFTHITSPEGYDEEALEWTGYPLAFDFGIANMGVDTTQCRMGWFNDAGWLDARLTKEVKAVIATYNANSGSMYSIAVIQVCFYLPLHFKRILLTI